MVNKTGSTKLKSTNKDIDKYVSELLSTGNVIKLNVGCGTDYKEGWVNIDNNTDNNIEKLDLDWDLRNPLPFPDDSVDYIFNEHFQEHLTVEEGISANKDFLRVLKPAGVLRIATPDLNKIVYNYKNTPLSEDEVIQEHHFDSVKTPAEWINMSFSSWGHKWVYDFEELDRRLHEAGFMDVRRCELQKSEHEDLRDIETRSGISLIVEATKKANITIGILTYNHEKYIEECLESVVSQTGNFNLRVVIVNDRSKDDTDKVIKKFIANNKNIDIKYVVNESNLGAQKSIYKTLGLIKETKPDYWSYIEGDDKYLDGTRTQKHLDLLSSHKLSLVSYNKLLLIDENSDLISKHEPTYLNETLTTKQLAAQNHIGSFCATFYSAKCFDFFDVNEFNGLTVYDWFFNIWMSQFGEIRLLPEYLTGYRQHSTSVWSSKSKADQYWELIQSIDSYNKKLDFNYDKSFQSYKHNLINQLSVLRKPMKVDVAIISSSIPSHDGSSFMESLAAYILGHRGDSVIIPAGKKKKILLEQVQRYKQKNPTLADKVIGYDGDYLMSIRCIYATSIDDAYIKARPIVNRHNTLLVFEVNKDDETSIKTDTQVKKQLKAIFHSDGFVKVVVHSKAVKKYLIDNKLCATDRVFLLSKEGSKKHQADEYHFRVYDILEQCLKGELKPVPSNLLKKVRRIYLKARMSRYINGSRINRNTIMLKTKSVVRQNKIAYKIAKSIYDPARSFYRSKMIK